MLRHTLNTRLGHTGLPAALTLRLWSAAAIAAAVAWAVKLVTGGGSRPVIAAVLVMTPYGLVYLGVTLVFGIQEARGLLARVRRFV
jgi:putative peptidoglycan lipid II flippase